MNRRPHGDQPEEGRTDDPVDRELAALLLEMEGSVPGVNHEKLRHRIVEATGLRPVRHEGVVDWWKYAARWSRAGIPLSAAACLLLGVALIGPGRTPVPEGPDGVPARERPAGVETVELPLLRELMDGVSGPKPTDSGVGARSLQELLLLDALRED